MTLTESRAARAAREAPAGGPEKVTRRKRQEVTFDLVSPCSIHAFIHWCIFYQFTDLQFVWLMMNVLLSLHDCVCMRSYVHVHVHVHVVKIIIM